MSNTNNSITISLEGAGLTSLPTDELGWSKADSVFLQDNAIEELDASVLPKGLLFLDMSYNPIKKIVGTFPETLVSLVLTSTQIQKLPILPDSLTELVIKDTPLAAKYGIMSDITDKALMNRVSDVPFEKYTIMEDNSPVRRKNNHNNGNNNNNNTGLSTGLNKAGSKHRLVMILERVETINDIGYKVQTLNDGEKIIMKQHLEPFEPKNASLLTPLAFGVYTKEGHGEDILFEKPVPPGCVYVTIEECGVLSSNWGKLLFAFEDKPAGIREKLRNPIRYRLDLMAHFGRSFHIHYPEAEHHGDRTYMDTIHYPFLIWNKEKCRIGKSGVLKLGDQLTFVNNSIKANEPYDEAQVLKTIDCNNITDDDLHKLFDGSYFPTYDMVKNDVSYMDEPLTYKALNTVMEQYQFTQSWSFKMFPGIHYNFSCRDIAKHPKSNERITRRRRNSMAGRFVNINRAPADLMKSRLGFDILKGYIRAGITEMVPKMIEKGVDVNGKDEDGKTLLQYAVGSFKTAIVKELLKVPDIDKTGAIEAIDDTMSKLTAKNKSEEQIASFRVHAEELRALFGGKRKTRRSKRI